MERIRNWLWIFVGLLTGIAATLFIIQNPGDLSLSFAFWVSPSIPLWAALFGSLLIGFALAHILSLLTGWSSVRERWSTRRRVRELEREVTALRNLPLSDLPNLERAHHHDPNHLHTPSALSEDDILYTPNPKPKQTTTHKTTHTPTSDAQDPYASVFSHPDPAEKHADSSVLDMQDSSLYPVNSND